MDIDALVQEKLDADTEFQTTLIDLSDDEKVVEIDNKRKEILASEFSTLAEKEKKALEVAENQKRRAEKAEGELKKHNPQAPVQPPVRSDDLSAMDAAYLYTKVHEDDVPEVVKAMKLLSITDPKLAIKDETVQAILAKREEHRKTEHATNIRTARPGATKVSDDEILRRASQGEIPEAGTKEAEALFWARRGGKKK